uniref:Uncharacterized protein n=1 Tax=Cyanothece sp. (strain PCC 7425 / ATCC 29141) TaxID=395961 RepID=B8HRV6_CYAP4
MMTRFEKLFNTAFLKNNGQSGHQDSKSFLGSVYEGFHKLGLYR